MKKRLSIILIFAFICITFLYIKFDIFYSSNINNYEITKYPYISPIYNNEYSASKNNSTSGKLVEKLNRGLIAISTNDGILISWRSLGTENSSTIYELYKNNACIYRSTENMATCYLDTTGTEKDSYYVLTNKISKSEEVTAHSETFFDIKLNVPEKSFNPRFEKYTYFPGDASCGDLDGDGEYEIILKWEPSNSKDNSQTGYTGNTILDAYKLDGTLLWRIDLGKNIRSGAHYTPFLVYDFDSNGKAELVCRTSDGSIDGKGKAIGNSEIDYRNKDGIILTGNEYLTVFDGITGEEITSITFEPARGNTTEWGDNYGNRSERFLAAVAYLNGKTPSIIMCRGYYELSCLTAYNFNGKKLEKVWNFTSKNENNLNYNGQGNHNLCIADVDNDSFDEIVYGQCCIDNNGTGLWSLELGHGDMINVGDFLPDRNGLEVFGCLEDIHGIYIADANTGEILNKYEHTSDTTRALAANFTSGNNSAEFFFADSSKIYEYTNNVKSTSSLDYGHTTFAVWWTGTLERSALNDTIIKKYDSKIIFDEKNITSINGTKSTPTLTADILGDWREEIIFPTKDGKALRVYLSDYETNYRIYTLMHNTMYRCGVANENVGYNISPNTDYFLDENYPLPDYPYITTP